MALTWMHCTANWWCWWSAFIRVWIWWSLFDSGGWRLSSLLYLELMFKIKEDNNANGFPFDVMGITTFWILIWTRCSRICMNIADLWMDLCIYAGYVHVPWLLLLIFPIPLYGSGLLHCYRVYIICFSSFLLEWMLTW